MKKIKMIFILVMVSILLPTCETFDSFLDSYPKTYKTESTFFQSETEMYQALSGCYNGMQRWLNDGGNWVWPIVCDIMSDDASGGAGKSDYLLPQAIDRFDKDIAPSESNIYSVTWRYFWETISRVNTFIVKAESFTWNDNSDFAKSKKLTKATALAEVRFIRAYLYFCSMQLWGHLPLVDEKTQDASLAEQVDPKYIYELIVNDLKAAIQDLPASIYIQGSDFSGRATKYAAEALLARVYLYYTGYYGKTQAQLPRVDKAGLISHMSKLLNESEVKNYLSDVINNSGHGLVDNFGSLWAAGSAAAGIVYAGEDNKEIVFAIKHGYVGRTRAAWVSDMGARAFPMPPYGRGWGFDIGNKPLWDAWDANDTRKVASLFNVLQEVNSFNGGNLYNDVSAGRDVREYQSLFLKKYLRQIGADGKEVYGMKVGNPTSMQSFTDFVVIRYSDVLLMAAELGIDPQTNFDEVRNRAYGGTAPYKEATFENIMDERRWEFVGESLRYWDLLRRGLEYCADKIEITPPGVQVRNGANIYGTTNIVIHREAIMNTYGLSQIPANEISLSYGRIVQNEGW